MMITVKIDRGSVKKNPNAGNRVHNELIGVYVTFEGSADYVPSWLLPYIIQERSTVFKGDMGVGYQMEGRLDDPEHLDKLEEYAKNQANKGHKFTITHNRQWQQIYSLEPESTWLYEYLDPDTTCSACKAVIKVSDMDTEEPYNRTFVDKCPKCFQLNTFPEVQFEDIGDVVKELNLV